MAGQTFIEPLPYQSFALHENSYSAVISREENIPFCPESLYSVGPYGI